MPIFILALLDIYREKGKKFTLRTLLKTTNVLQNHYLKMGARLATRTLRTEPEPPEMWRLRSVSHIEKPLVNACLKAIRFRKRFEAEPLFSTL